MHRERMERNGGNSGDEGAQQILVLRPMFGDRGVDRKICGNHFFGRVIVKVVPLPGNREPIVYSLYGIKSQAGKGSESRSSINGLKPFFMTTSYATYMELRPSSQSLPSAIGRIFVIGRSAPYKYLIPPEAIHVVIRILSTTILAVSLLTVWRRLKPKLLGLSYVIFLLLLLITPSYCIWYTWAYLFVLYFATLNYMSYPDIKKKEKLICSKCWL